jgi:hypothetical protein
VSCAHKLRRGTQFHKAFQMVAVLAGLQAQVAALAGQVAVNSTQRELNRGRAAVHWLMNAAGALPAPPPGFAPITTFVQLRAATHARVNWYITFYGVPVPAPRTVRVLRLALEHHLVSILSPGQGLRTRAKRTTGKPVVDHVVPAWVACCTT